MIFGSEKSIGEKRNQPIWLKMMCFLLGCFAQTIAFSQNQSNEVEFEYVFLDSQISFPKMIPADAKWNKRETIKTGLSSQLGMTLWIKLQVPPVQHLKDPVLRVEKIYTRFELFHGNSRVYSFGQNNRYPGLPVQLLPIPMQPNPPPMYLRIESNLPRVGLLGAALIGQRNDFVSQLVMQDIPAAFVVSVLVLIGIVGLILFFMYPKVRTYLNLALFSLAASLYLFARMRSKTFFGVDPVASGFAGLLGLFATPCFFVAFFREIFGIKQITFLRNLQIACGAFLLVASIGSTFTKTGPLDFLLPFYLLSIPVFAIILYHAINHLRFSEQSKIFFTGVACIFITGLWEVARELKFSNGTFPIFVWGFLGFVLSLTSMQGRFFATLFHSAKDSAAAADNARERLERVLVCAQELGRTRNYKSLIMLFANAIINELNLRNEKISIDLFIPGPEDSTDEKAIYQFRYLAEQESVSELYEVNQDLIPPGIQSEVTLNEKVSSFPGIFLKSEDSEKMNPKRNASSVLTVPLSSQEFLGAVTIRRYDNDKFDIEDHAHLSRFINSLSASLLVALQNLDYVSDVRKKSVLEHEMEAAMTLQSALLPDPLDIKNVEYAAYCHSAGKTGGDWFGYYHCKLRNRLFITVGDVTGHDFASSIMTGLAAGVVKGWEQNTSGEFAKTDEALADLAALVNKVLSSSNKGLKFMTMAFVGIELSTGKVYILNAGHPHLFHVSKKNGISPFVSSGNILGQDPNALFHADSLCLESGDSLIIYTDGLFENQGPESKTLSRRVLTKSLNSEDEALHTLNNILSLARNIWKNHPPDDDVTLLVLKWHYLENYVTSVA